MRERMNSQEDEMRKMMNAQEETLRTHGEMLNYLYQEARHRQSGGLGNEHGFGLGHDGGSGRGHVVRRGRGSGHGIGGSGGKMRQTSTPEQPTQSSDVLLDFNTDSLPENLLYTEQTTPQSATVQANHVEGQSSTHGMEWGFSSHFERMDVAGQTIGEVEDLSRMFSFSTPPCLNTPEETLSTGVLIAQSEIVMSPGTADVHRVKRKVGDIVADNHMESNKKLKNRSTIKQPLRIGDGSQVLPPKIGGCTPHKRFPEEMVKRFDTWYANPIPPTVHIPCGKVLNLVEDTEVGKEFYERLLTPNLSTEQPQVDACINLMKRQMERHLEYFRSNTALTYSDFALYLGDAHIHQDTAISHLTFPESLQDLVRTWKEDTVVYMPWPIWKGHWAALEVDIGRWRITVYDCLLRLLKVNDDVGMKVVGLGDSMRRVLEMDEELRKHPQFFTGRIMPLEVVIADEKDVPQMEIPCDCGVYAVKHIEHLMHGEPLKLIRPPNMKYLRCRLCVELFNQCLDFYS